MNDFFTSLFSRFTSENTSYGSPEIKPEPTEESNEPAAKDTAAIIEEQKVAIVEPASPTSSEQKITPKPKKTAPLPGLMYPDDIKALTDKYGVLCG